MPGALRALKTVSKSQNGVGAFILQCKRMEFNYCDHGGSSKGMRAFLRSTLPNFAKANPQVEIIVAPRPSAHPIIRGVYINGREKVICVRNLEPSQVQQKAELLRDSSGARVKRVNKPVSSMNTSVRGIWSPYHSPNQGIHRI